MLTSEIHRRKPPRKPMPKLIAQAIKMKSSVRPVVEHVFGYQKNAFGMFIRTIGLDRATAKINSANLAYNFHRLMFHERRRLATR